MQLTLRPFYPDADYPALAAWMRRVRGDARDAEAWREADARGGPGRVRLLVYRDDELVAWGQVRPQRPAPPGIFSLAIHVAPDQSAAGARRALYERLVEEAHLREARALQAEVQESDADAHAFFATCGFSETNREWESRLEVAGFDPAPFAAAEQRARDYGVTITTFAAQDERTLDADAGEALRRAVHALEVACARDEPSNAGDDEGMPYPVYVRVILSDPSLLRDGYFLARRGDDLVGISNLFRSASEDGLLKQGLTGVLREHRRRGIATALKLATVRYAHTHGYRQISTRNNPHNRPMLAINEAMGFKKEPAWITLEKVLSDSAGGH
jgi:GNAT superfamily N-acetyltransferase